MFENAQWDGADLSLSGARVVTPEGVIDGGIAVEGGQIAAVGPDVGGTDCGGDYIVPGCVDVHTDHVERHVVPRRKVFWNHAQALMAHDGVVIAGGTTTVFDSLAVGGSLKNPERAKMLGPLVDALEQGVEAQSFRAEHFLHMRCEISDPETMALTDANIQRPITRLVSVMDHTPGDRQSMDIADWTRRMAIELQVDLAEAERHRDELLERSARVGAEVRAHVVGAARARGIPTMSHDDRTEAHVSQSQAEGITIAEFPTTVAAAARARALGLIVVAGAPNYLRGGSQSGNVAVRDLLVEGLVDVLASDYVPRSPLEMAFALAEDPSLPFDLPATMAMASLNPARAAGLTDRGALTPGLRGDLVRVARKDGYSIVRGVWRAGTRVF